MYVTLLEHEKYFLQEESEGIEFYYCLCLFVDGLVIKFFL